MMHKSEEKIRSSTKTQKIQILLKKNIDGEIS